MAIQFLPRESRTHRICASWLLLGAVIALGGLVLPGYNASAATPDKVLGLRPYTAQYKTTTRGMELDLTRKLKSGADGSYILTNGGKIMVVGFHEVSVFQVEGTRIVPRSYV